jgi:hypothetical protein
MPSPLPTNFLDLYLHACGTSETPIQYHQWCSIATIAACVGDRVWYEKFKGEKLSPNLYLILLGPSGIGKGTAMKFSHKLIQDIPGIRIWNGQITAPKLIDKLGKAEKVAGVKGRKVISNSKMVLMTPEMATSVGRGEMTDKFVKLMTALYEGHTMWSEGTRTSGEFEIKECNINWQAGSTSQWMVECLPKSSIDSGFLARSVVVKAAYDYSVRVPEPYVPDDFVEAYGKLKAWVFALAGMEGEFRLCEEAKEIHTKWYMTRPPENDVALEAAWHRDDDLVLKLAMILALNEWDCELIVYPRHLVKAQRLVKEAHRHLPGLLSQASQTPQTEIVDMARAEIKKSRRILHRALLQKMGARGKNAAELREAINFLRGTGEVEIDKGPRGGLIYRWR